MLFYKWGLRFSEEQSNMAQGHTTRIDKINTRTCVLCYLVLVLCSLELEDFRSILFGILAWNVFVAVHDTHISSFSIYDIYDDSHLVYLKYFHFRLGMYDSLFSWISNLFSFFKSKENFSILTNVSTALYPICKPYGNYYKEHD